MLSQRQLARLRARRSALVEELRRTPNLMRGIVYERQRKCGRRSCTCARGGPRHPHQRIPQTAKLRLVPPKPRQSFRRGPERMHRRVETAHRQSDQLHQILAGKVDLKWRLSRETWGTRASPGQRLGDPWHVVGQLPTTAGHVLPSAPTVRPRFGGGGGVMLPPPHPVKPSIATQAIQRT